ncbi:hypothetical protein [Fusobacterium necrogenes]|uniref:hypothetical protein n=1 Tax=Fusobacterium necrogenes TaxID=858 RepID=UPI000E1BCF25|nr:hypothetical protein [Fusobacterium necrogenes]
MIQFTLILHQDHHHYHRSHKKNGQNSDDVVYADLNLGAGSGVIHGGSDTIYTQVKGSGGGGDVAPKPPKRDESLTAETARKIDDLMKQQEILTSKGELSDADKRKLDQIEKDLAKELAQLQKDLGDKGPAVPPRGESLNKK